MTKPILRPCPHCQALNQASRKSCGTCFKSLLKRQDYKKRQDKLVTGGYKERMLMHGNACKVTNSAHLIVSVYIFASSYDILELVFMKMFYIFYCLVLIKKLINGSATALGHCVKLLALRVRPFALKVGSRDPQRSLGEFQGVPS